MGFWGAICGAIGGISSKIGGAIERTNDTNVKKEETEFEKTQKYINFFHLNPSLLALGGAG